MRRSNWKYSLKSLLLLLTGLAVTFAVSLLLFKEKQLKDGCDIADIRAAVREADENAFLSDVVGDGPLICTVCATNDYEFREKFFDCFERLIRRNIEVVAFQQIRVDDSLVGVQCRYRHHSSGKRCWLNLVETETSEKEFQNSATKYVQHRYLLWAAE